jgi:hypothetical protein
VQRLYTSNAVVTCVCERAVAQGVDEPLHNCNGPYYGHRIDGLCSTKNTAWIRRSFIFCCLEPRRNDRRYTNANTFSSGLEAMRLTAPDMALHCMCSPSQSRGRQAPRRNAKPGEPRAGRHWGTSRPSEQFKSLGLTRMHGSGKPMRVLQAGCRGRSRRRPTLAPWWHYPRKLCSSKNFSAAFPRCRKPHFVNAHVQVQAQVGNRLAVVSVAALLLISELGSCIAADLGSRTS